MEKKLNFKQKKKPFNFTKTELFDYFRKLANVDSNSCSEEQHENDEHDNSRATYSQEMKEISETILNCQFMTEDFKAMIIKLKSGKSPGIDRIIAELLKDLNDDTLNTTLNIFNKILNAGEFPEEWAVGIIIILFKGGENNNLNK